MDKTKLGEFAQDLQSMIADHEDAEGAPDVETVAYTPSMLTDSEFLGVTFEDGRQYSIHIQETQ